MKLSFPVFSHVSPALPHAPLRRCGLVLTFIWLGLADMPAAKVALRAAAATTTKDAASLAKAVDGVEAGPEGWRVRTSGAAVQSAVFTCPEPLPPGRLRLWLSFLSGSADSAFRDFSLSITREARPALSGRWEKLAPTWQSTTEGTLERANGRLMLTGDVKTPVFLLDTPPLPGGITGLRVDVHPSEGQTADAVLTEIRAERKDVITTNIALGCPVSSSYPLGPDQRPEHLTDGLSGTMVHPASPDPGPGFHLEVDLRRIVALDHLALRNRADGKAPERLSRLKIEVYTEAPSSGAAPAWTTRHREDGSYPEPGHTDVIRASVGEGEFRGRYIRISSSSPVAFSPQLAELEVYESMVPPGVTVTAGHQVLPQGDTLQVPANAPWITFAIEHPKMPAPFTLGRRWRLAGVHDEWLPVPGNGVVEMRCPPPGRYQFQASLRHTDLEWNDVSLTVPLIVPLPFWERPLARAGAVLLCVILASMVAWSIARRRMALRVAELERRQQLERERARIARDMHDVVGSRLTQLTVMHEIFAAEHPMPGDAGDKLQQLGATARAAITELDEAVWAVNPRNDTLSSLANYLCHTAAEYLNPLGIACRQDLPEEWPEVPVESHLRHELLLAFKEALQNVAKHAQATQVSIRLRFDAPTFRVRLEDNGQGLPDAVGGAEKDGLRNMNSRLAAIGGNCRVQSRPNGGTMVEMEVHLHPC